MFINASFWVFLMDNRMIGLLAYVLNICLGFRGFGHRFKRYSIAHVCV